MPSTYQPGQVLTADELNASLDAKTDNANANITGGQINGLTLLSVSGTLPSTIPANGALTVAGGAGIGGNVNAGGYVAAPVINATGNTNSSSPTTGALLVSAGGAGVAGNIFAGGTINAAGGVVGNTVRATGGTPATSTTTGALVVTGGAGVSGALYAGSVNAGTLNVTGGANIAGGINIDSISVGAINVAGGVMAINNANLLVNATGEFADTDWTFPGTAASFPGTIDPISGSGIFTNAVALSAAATDASAPMPIGANQPMTLTADLNASGVTAGTLTATLIAQNAVGASLGTVCSVSATNGQPWKTLTASGTTPANTVRVVLTKALTGSSVAAPMNGAAFRRMKVEAGASATMYSGEGSMGYVQTLATNIANNAAITYAIALG